MAAPLDPAKLDDAIQRYLAREPLKQIKAATGVSSSVLNRERIRRGIPPRPKVEVPWDEVIAAYEAGESEYSLSQRFGRRPGPASARASKPQECPSATDPRLASIEPRR
jgi:hypothetical protein